MVNKWFKKYLAAMIIFALAGGAWLFSYQTRAELIFKEARQWQIASDTVANMILLWDDVVQELPSDWTCISCNPGDDFYQKFIRGGTSYATTGGNTTHTHSGPSVTDGGYSADTGNLTESGGSVSLPGTHNDHTSSVNSGLSGTDLNIPQYRYLKVVRYNYGIPETLPAGAIAIWADARPPGEWTDVYNDAGTPRYIQGYGTVGGTGGANTHYHTLGLSSSGATLTTTGATKTGSAATVADASHYHTFTATGNTGNADPDNEPPYMTVILSRKNADGPIPQNMIAMFDDTPPAADWTVNSGSGQDFDQRFFKPTGTYGTSRDISTHIHTGCDIESNGDAATIVIKSTGTGFCSPTHTHTFTVGSLDSQPHLPPYRDAIFAKAGTTPTPDLQQIHYHWRNDDNDEANASSATSGSEDDVYSSFPPTSNKRLRLEISNEGGAAAADVQFRIDYGLKVTDCTSASYTDVGAVGDDDWDMADSQLVEGNDTTNIAVSTGGVTDAPAPSTFKTSNSAQKETSSLVAPITLTYEDFIEMEFSIKPNVSSGDYCFRVSNNGDITNFNYQIYAEATVVGVSLSFAVDSASLDFETLTPSTPITIKTSTLTVTTDSTDGFIIKVARNAGNTTLDLIADDSFDITDHTAWNATTPNSTIITSGDDFLAFRVASADTDSGNYNSTWWGDGDTLGTDAKYAGFPTPSDTIVNRGSISDPSTDSVVRYYIDVANTQKMGTYDGGVTYTATAN